MKLSNDLNCTCCLEHKTCIQKVPIFSNLNSKEKMEIQRIIKGIHYRKGEVVFLPGRDAKSYTL